MFYFLLPMFGVLITSKTNIVCRTGFLIFCFIFIIHLVVGQSQYTFRVLFTKGPAYLNNDTLKVGVRMIEGDRLILKSGGKVGLVHYSSKPLEVKQEGRYSVKDLEILLIKAQSNYNYPFNDRKADVVYEINTLGESEVILFSTITLFWCPIDTFIVKQYRVNVMNVFDDVLESYITTNTYLELDLQRPKIKGEPALLVQIMDNKPSSGARSKLLVLKRTKTIDEEIEKKLRSDSTDPDYWITLGEECKSKLLLFNALHAYHKALMISPSTISNHFFDFAKVYYKPDLEVIGCLEN